MANQLLVTLDGIKVDIAGVPAKCFIEELGAGEALRGVVYILASIVRYLSGGQMGHGQESSNWIYSPKGLQLRPSGPGCLFARWTFEPSPDHRTTPKSFETLAIDTLLELGGREDSARPDSMMDNLREISVALPKSILLWLGDSDNPNKVGVRPMDDPDAGLELHGKFSAELQASMEAVAVGGTTHAAEHVAQGQNLSW